MFVVRVLRSDPALHQPVADGESHGYVGLPVAVHVSRQLAEGELQVAEDPRLEGFRVHALPQGGERLGNGSARRSRRGNGLHGAFHDNRPV